MTIDFESFTLAAATGELDEEPAVRKHADAVEFRMDLAEEPLDALQNYDGELPIIVTNRAEWEGGEAPDLGRIDALENAVSHDVVEAVDIELTSVLEGDCDALLDEANQHEVSVIVSKHDFEKTPPRDELDNLLSEAGEYGDVAKLAVMAKNFDDTLALIDTTHQHVKQGETVATMAMGAAGRHTRAMTAVYGSCIGYASVGAEEATASGQYDVKTLRTLIDQLY